MVCTRRASTVCAAIGATIALSLISQTAIGSDVSAFDFELAQTFRRSMGLPASDQVVLKSYSDADYSSERYGLPLSQNELAELAVRARIREQMQGAMDEAQTWADFGGIYIDQKRDGIAVLQFTKDIDSHAARLERLMPDTARYETAKVQYRYTELMELKSRVARQVPSLEKDGLDIVQVGPDDARNRLVVGVTGGVAAAQKLLEERFGPAVVVELTALGQMDACSRDDCRPLKGGLEIQGDLGALDLCTSAFIAKTSGGTKRLVTAGHCMVGRLGHTWKHNGSSLGTALDHTLESSEATCGDSGDDYCADAGWFALDSNETPLADPHRFLRGNGLVYSFDDVRHNGSQQVGDPILRAGRTTGLEPGLITARNQRRKTIGSNGKTYWIDPVFVMDRDARGGDSGGPYWVEYDFAGWRFRMVAGIHSHSTPDTNDPNNPCEEDDNDPNVPDCRAWYTTADRFEARTPLTICTLASCQG